MADLRAIFFDLGGTLFSNRQIPVACTPVLIEAAERLGVGGGLAGVGRAFVDATRVTNEYYLARPYYLHRDLFIDTAARLQEGLEIEPSDAFNVWFYEAQRAVMVREMVLRDDCLDTLAALRSRGLTLSLVSNIDDDFLEPMLDNMGLRPYLDHFISSEAARSCKPDAGIFRTALDRVGCVPDEVIFVGDSRIHDIQGARAVGIRSVLISEEGGVSHLDDESFDAQPDHVIGKLGELKEIVDRRGEGEA
jgi:HAD superfamily hydrolase (TIGR01509 family)